MEPVTANTGMKLSSIIRHSNKKPTTQSQSRKASRALEDIKRNPDVISRLPHDVLLSLPEQVLNELPADRLHHLPEDVLATRVSPERLLTIPDIARLPASILAKFPPERLAELPNDRLISLLDPMRLPPTVVASLPPHALAMLPVEILDALPVDVRSMLPCEIQNMLEERASRVPKLKDPSVESGVSGTEGIPTLSFEGPKTSDLPSISVEQISSTAVASEPSKAQLDAKFPPLPFRPLDVRPRSGEYPPHSQSREPHSGPDQEKPQLERHPSQPSSTHSKESRKRQSISRRQAVNSWLGNTAPTVASGSSQFPSGQHHDVPILSELADLRAERDALRDEKARLTDIVQEIELALWRDNMLRKEHEEKIADLEKRFKSERDDLLGEKTKLAEKVQKMESFVQNEIRAVHQHWGQYRKRISEKDSDGEIVMKTLVFARKLVDEYQRQLDEKTESGKGKEAKLQDLQAEVDGLKAKVQKKDADIKDELSRLESAHEKELEGTRNSLLEQVQKLQKFGKTQHQKAKAAAETHQKELAKMEADLETRHRDEMDSLISKFEQEKSDADTARNAALLTMETKHAVEMTDLCQQHAEQLADLQRRMDERQLATESQLVKQQEENDLLHRERRILHASIQQLQADAVMQQSQHQEVMSSLRTQKGHLRQAVDGDLRTLFGRLQFGIEVVTEPVNMGDMTLPPGSPLDPEGFIERNGEGALRFLLRHLVWNVIMNGFFSAPFGFGVFGDGEGRNRLFELYATWRGLFAPNQEKAGESSQPPTPDLGVFLQDPEANRWRSSTFVSIRSTMSNPNTQELDQPLSPFAANIIKVKKEILGVLSVVTTNLPEEISNKVDEIVSLAGEIALETGIHESHLGLLMPAPGISAHIGQEFIDCEDEYTISRAVETVELGVCPYFYRIGDGTGDLSTTWAIARGKVYIKR